jgi:ribosomal protein S18 acetylase RimI-like enzyme
MLNNQKPLPMISFRPMSSAEFEVWLEASVHEYAHEKAIAGVWTEDEALEKALLQTDQLLYLGQQTPGHVFENVFDCNGAAIGSIWLGHQAGFENQKAWLYDIKVNEALRGKGFGRAIVHSLVERSQKNGFLEFGLNVFGHNESAQKLYSSLGFKVTSQQMKLVL